MGKGFRMSCVAKRACIHPWKCPWRYSRSGCFGLWAIWSICRLSLQEGWTKWPLKASSNSKNSMKWWHPLLREVRSSAPPHFQICPGSITSVSKYNQLDTIQRMTPIPPSPSWLAVLLARFHSSTVWELVCHSGSITCWCGTSVLITPWAQVSNPTGIRSMQLLWLSAHLHE